MARPTIDFFASQDRAKRFSFFFSIGFALTIIFTVLIIYFAGAWFFVTFARGSEFVRDLFGSRPNIWQPKLFLITSLTIGLTVLIASLRKIAEIKEDGGYGLALLLGGQAITPESADPNEQRILNIVEEMAIASGLPCPEVIILTAEPGINAFAAGYSPQTAIIGLTRGAIDLLDRDELQGVVAHEFAHILGGDMKLNLSLIGWLYGLLFLSIAGTHLIRGRRPLLIFAGAVLIAGGLTGRFAAQILQAAISRQREFLADAYAAQFTRNPEGLARALAKIGGLATGGTIKSPAAALASHLFIESPVKAWFGSHPPLRERIRILDPKWTGRFITPSLNRPAQTRISEQAIKKRKAEQEKNLAKQTRQAQVQVMSPLVAPVMSLIGSLAANSLDSAATVLRIMPARLHAATKNPREIKALAGAILYDAQQQEVQLPILRRVLGREKSQEILAWHEQLDKIKPDLRLPLLDLAAPTLKNFSPAEKDDLLAFAQELIAADSRMSLFEFATLRILEQSLHKKDQPVQGRHIPAPEFKEAVEVLLSILAHIGHSENQAQASAAFGRGCAIFKNTIGAQGLKSREVCRVDLAMESLKVLSEGTPVLKKKVLTAAVICAQYDELITGVEYELLRAIAAALGYPMPLMEMKAEAYS